jgi:hypothetical protein
VEEVEQVRIETELEPTVDLCSAHVRPPSRPAVELSFSDTDLIDFEGWFTEDAGDGWHPYGFCSSFQ